MLHLLLLDEGFMSGALSAVGLRDAGCHVTLVAGVGGRGQYDARRLVWRLAPGIRRREYLEAVNALVRQETFDHVLPLTEPIQSLLWAQAPPWSDRIFPPTTPWQRSLIEDKWRLSALAESLGLVIPTQLRLRSPTDINDAVDRLGLPMVVKGVAGRGGVNTIIVSSLSGARHAVARLDRRCVPCFAQRFIAGPTYLVGGLFDAGRALRLYAGEKLVQHPRRTGPAAVIRSVHDEHLLSAARHLTETLAWTGIASLDFVRDREGRYHFLELNPRPWGSIGAAELAGVDLWSPLAALLRDEEIAPKLDYRAGVGHGVLPLALLSAPGWLSGSTWLALVRAVADGGGHPTGQTLHVAHRLTRMAIRWGGVA
jgi:hypothetical protein